MTQREEERKAETMRERLDSHNNHLTSNRDYFLRINHFVLYRLQLSMCSINYYTAEGEFLVKIFKFVRELGRS